jgi:DNA excision repair protein ERCC-2
LFAEGIDYPGETLSGVIVVSPALPQLSFERELMRQYYDQRYGKGFEFAYLYPGMNRVIQSVGRLIRSETDRGVAVLVCQRFAQPQYSTLFPPDWSDSMMRKHTRHDLATELADFWAGLGQRPRPSRAS